MRSLRAASAADSSHSARPTHAWPPSRRQFGFIVGCVLAIAPLGACSDSGTGNSSDVSVPDVSVSLPDVSLPDVSLPDVSLPDVSLPDVSLPSGGSNDTGGGSNGTGGGSNGSNNEATAPPATGSSSDSASSSDSSGGSSSSDSGFPVWGFLIVGAIILGFIALIAAAHDRRRSQSQVNDERADQTASGIDDVVTKAQWADEQVSKVLASQHPDQLASVDSTLQWHLAQLETSTGQLADSAPDDDTAKALGGVGSALAGLRGALSAYLTAAQNVQPAASGTQLRSGGGVESTSSAASQGSNGGQSLSQLRDALDKRRQDLGYATQRLTALRTADGSA